MGVACWLFWIAIGDRNEAWVNSGSWTGRTRQFWSMSNMIVNNVTVPAIIAPLAFTLIHRHPEPFEACPCFETLLRCLQSCLVPL